MGRLTLTRRVAMSLLFYDLVGEDDRRFSPYCWRVRLALWHKGLVFEERAVRFTDIPQLYGGRFRTVPILADGKLLINDSMAIARYLESAYPNPPLFEGGFGEPACQFLTDWCATEIHPLVAKMIAHDIFTRLSDDDQVYFRSTREKRFGMPLEDVQAGRDLIRPQLAAALSPVRGLLGHRDFLIGRAPTFADYIIFSVFQWAETMSDYTILDDSDGVINNWRRRCASLVDAYATPSAGAALQSPKA